MEEKLILDAGVHKNRRLSYSFSDGAIPVDRGSSEQSSDSLGLSLVQNESDLRATQVGEYQVLPWGEDNLLPNKLRRLFENNLVPGLLDFKADAIYGAGFTLVDVRSGAEEGFLKEWGWLDSWDVDNYLVQQTVDYCTYENVFGQIRASQNGDILDILHVNAQECRLLAPPKSKEMPEAILVGDYTKGSGIFKSYPIWNKFDDIRGEKFSHKIAMYQGKRPTPGFKYYNYPVYVGAVNKWIPLADKIPVMHSAALDNTMMVAYHVTIPYEQLIRMKEVRSWTEEQLQKYLDEKLDEIDSMLCGAKNAGKNFVSFSTQDDRGNSIAWKIEMIENNRKEMSESHLRLFNDANQALTSAFQVQPSLACIQLGDKMSSGSEVLNSFNLHIKTRTPIPRRIITDTINAVLKLKFPGTTAKLIFKDVTLVPQAENKTGIAK